MNETEVSSGNGVEAEAIFVGSNVDEDFLVTVWKDGSATAAFRTLGERTWGPPIQMERRPAE